MEFKDGDNSDTNLDGIGEYGYGFWFKYMSLFPDRIRNKPNWM